MIPISSCSKCRPYLWKDGKLATEKYWCLTCRQIVTKVQDSPESRFDTDIDIEDKQDE